VSFSLPQIILLITLTFQFGDLSVGWHYTVDNANCTQVNPEVWKNALGERYFFHWQWCHHSDIFWKPCTFLTRHFLSQTPPTTGQPNPIVITNTCMCVFGKLVTSKIILKIFEELADFSKNIYSQFTRCRNVNCTWSGVLHNNTFPQQCQQLHPIYFFKVKGDSLTKWNELL
jgi:hypothetical protein